MNPTPDKTLPGSNAVSGPECPGVARRIYPDALCTAEAARVKQRRSATDTAKYPVSEGKDRETVANATGLACSGGGIRSATFCLGVAQWLAAKGVLEKFDFISTVSGGGYFGSFLSRLIQRKTSVKAAQETLKNNDSQPIRWLRENGYYLAPSGSADIWTILAQVLRNMTAVHLMLLGVFALPFLFGNALRLSLQKFQWWSNLESSHFLPGSSSAWAWSPWALPVIAVFAVGMAVPAFAFWTTQCLRDPARQQKWQTAFTRWLGLGLAVTVGLGLVAIMDSLGMWAYTTIVRNHGIGKGFAAIYASAALVFGGVQKFAGKLTEMVGNKKAGLPLMLITQVAGFAWALLFWATLATLGHWQLWQGAEPSPVVLTGGIIARYWLFAGVWLTVVCILSRFWGFVNLSSHQRYYSSRLRRAYLGAANEGRTEKSIVRTDDKDDIPWTKHEPHAFGGPLHIVNTTVNETISGKSQVEQRDRKGISLAVGPCGLSASTEHHALWGPVVDDAATVSILPIEEEWQKGYFRVFPMPVGSPTRQVESLTVGQWMGISGAAFSTGTGANTKLGLSLLLGFANVRLGYWWDSQVKPKERGTTSTTPVASQKLSRLISSILPAPHSLVDELLARFHGPAQRRWYLSDGGHFENTACYELLRRRVRFILCLDCGQDADMAFEDLANLTRKARIDLGAEMEFLEGAEAEAALKKVDGPHGWTPQINGSLIGKPGDFKPVKTKDGEAARDTGGKHALVARVRYDEKVDTDKNPVFETVILFLKPSLTEEVPVDIRNYHHGNPDFPQQSTADQFFDEAQWESYRRLGEYVAGKVIKSTTAAGSPAATP